MTDTYYLSKYALSSNGRITTFLTSSTPGEYGLVMPEGSFQCVKVGRDAHLTAEAAIAAAETARTKKIASLRKQVAALEKMKFTVENGHE